MRALRMFIVGLLLAAVAGPASAGMAKGGSVFAIQLTSGQGDFVQPEAGSGYIQALAHSEMGVQGQYWYMWNEEYAMTVSAGIGFARETDNPGTNSIPGLDEPFRDFYSSWQFRLGGDRVGKINDRFHVFAGPGVQFWGGKIEFKNGDTTVAETQTSNRIAVDGRLGMMLNWGQSFGMVGQIGHYWGYASAKDTGAEAKFTPSGPNAGMGVFFTF